MKTFLVYVLVSVGFLKDVKETVAEVLSSFAKTLEVAEHDAKCPCMYASVRAKAAELADTRVQISDCPKVGSAAEKNQSAFDNIVKYATDHEKAKQVAIQELLDKAAPEPHCKDCQGSGIIKSTANPNGKWTSWQIRSSLSNQLLADCLIDVVDDLDIVPVKLLNLEELPLPWAIVTPDGKWHAAGEPYWFGTTRIDDADWENTVHKILKQDSDKTLVVVECQY